MNVSVRVRGKREKRERERREEVRTFVYVFFVREKNSCKSAKAAMKHFVAPEPNLKLTRYVTEIKRE